MAQPPPASAGDPLDDADLEFEAALASHDLASAASPNSRTSTKASAPSGDYRDGAMYEPVGFGEFGAYMRNKRAKLQVQNKDLVEQAKGLPQIFRGLHIYINGYTDGITLPELQNLLIVHGGVYVPYLDQKSLVTHILAANLTPSKRHEFRDYKVTTPNWLTDSAKAGRLLDWRDYSLLAPVDTPPLPKGLEATAGARAAEDAARLGTQTGQRSLFSMGVGKGKAKPALTETRESLAERGARLGKEALEAQARAQAQAQAHAAIASSSSSSSSGIGAYFAAGRGAVSSASSARSPTKLSTSSRPTTPTKLEQQPVAADASDLPSTPDRAAAKLPATTDSAEKPTAVTRSWLPQAQRSERQNALLGDQDWLMRHTSSSVDFLAGYFAQSRLHLISNFKEDLKMLVAATQQSLPSRKKKLTGRASDGRTVFHVDFDCFFVSAGLTSRPELRGKPICVCHSRGNADAASSTSEIASCSYEARACGVRNGMSLGRARELCPEIQTMPFEFELYKSISMTLYSILLKHASFLQAVSIDEVLMEIKVEPTILREHDPALERAQQIRAEIFDATGCPASIGISHNILLAKLATRKAKPANAYHLLAEEVDEFIATLGVDELPGIGWSMRDKLKAQLGVETVGDLRKVPPHKLAKAIGPDNGRKFAAFAQGVDDRELELGKARQSVSTEVNYGIRFPVDRHDLVERFVRQVGVETARRLREQGLQSRQLTLKVMQRHPEAPVEAPKMLGHGWCTTENKVLTLAGRSGGATDDGDIVGETACKLMRSLQAPPHELRGIAVQLSKLEKDGVPVDRVLEKGQSRLSFKVAPRPAPPPIQAAQPVAPVAAPHLASLGATSTLSRATASTSRARLPSTSPPPPAPQRGSSIETVTLTSSPTDDPDAPSAPLPAAQSSPARPARALRKEPSAIVLDSTDDEVNDARPAPPRAASAASLGPLRSKTKRSRTPEVIVPHMFRTTKRRKAAAPTSASQVDDAELVYYEIDPGAFRSFDPALREEVLADARRRKPAPRKDKIKGKPRDQAKETTPVTTELPADSALPKAPRPPPDVVVLPPSPSKMTDSQLVAMEIEPDLFHALGSATQREYVKAVQQRKARLVVGNIGGGGGRKGSDGRPRAPVLDVPVRRPPRFGGQVDLDDIEDRIEVWVHTERDGAPNGADVDKLGRFVEKCAASDKGHDLKKATDVLKWWSYVLEVEVGKCATAEGTAALWWDGYGRVRERLEWLVLKETGCRLKIF
ncbi:hypothetical protein JCM3775_005429 [Rhodotorula graminis]